MFRDWLRDTVKDTFCLVVFLLLFAYLFASYRLSLYLQCFDGATSLGHAWRRMRDMRRAIRNAKVKI